MAKKWYVVHTYSGYENKVKRGAPGAHQAVQPWRTVRRDPDPDRDRHREPRAGGKSRVRQKNSFPGYSSSRWR